MKVSLPSIAILFNRTVDSQSEEKNRVFGKGSELSFSTRRRTDDNNTVL